SVPLGSNAEANDDESVQGNWMLAEDAKPQDRNITNTHRHHEAVPERDRLQGAPQVARVAANLAALAWLRAAEIPVGNRRRFAREPVPDGHHAGPRKIPAASRRAPPA